MSKPIFERRGRENEEKSYGLQGGLALVGFASHFFLLKDQATYKRRFEEAKVRKSNPNLIFCDFRFGRKDLT